MRIIPTEARAAMLALRDGLTSQQFVDEMWRRRVAEHPCQPDAKGRWPCLVYSAPSNVTPIREARGK